MMKSFFLIVVSLFAIATTANAQSITKPRVDERMELMSTVFRLAEASEFSQKTNPLYLQKLEKWFAPYKKHKVVEYTKLLRNDYGVAYDAVPKLAVMLKINKGKVSLDKEILLENLDYRWHRDSLPKYIEYLNDFYKKSKFQKFFESNSSYYQEVANRFQTNVLDKMNFQWFSSFFGENYLKNTEFRVVISVLSQYGNYGARAKYYDGKQYFYSINAIGGRYDEDNLPIFNQYLGGVVAHEFCHSFCNPLIDKYYEELKEQAEKFYNPYEKLMIKQSYGSPLIYLYEIFVRACETHFSVDQTTEEDYKKHQTTAEEYKEHIWWKSMQYEKNNGFLWIDSLYSALDEYKNNRTKYKNIGEFMPEIVKLQNRLVPEEIYQTFEFRRATILGTNIEDGAQDVDYNLDSVVVYFDKPMAIGNNGIGRNPYCEECKEPQPHESKRQSYWSEDGKSWVVFFKLEPDTEYGLGYANYFFRTTHKDKDGRYQFYYPKNEYYIKFKTRKKE